MNREIKFRAWDKANKKMCIVHSLLYTLGKIHELVVLDSKVLYKSVNSFELMQFTGIKDDNKIDVYEGDIIQLVGWEGIYYTVEYYESSFIAMKVIHKEINLRRYTYLHGLLQFEVVGNRYDNPELLNGGN